MIPERRRPLPGDRLGDVVLEDQVGEGAMGIVFRGRRVTDELCVAVKVLRPELSSDETYRQRFQREIRVATEARHPHLVQVIDAGRANDFEYIVVEFVAGGSLEDLLNRGSRPSIDGLARLGAQVAGALDTLHEQGLVHRDVKPSNVMLRSPEDAALTDFGLASGRAYTVLTRPGQVLGTLDYIAPELISGRPASPASDIYSLACLLYELIVGQPPFAGRGIYEIAVAHLEEEPVNPSRLRPDLPPDVGTVILLGLAKVPDERPPTATALTRMLGAAARG